MIKLLVLCFTLSFVSSVAAQEFKAFRRFGVGIGLGIAGGNPHSNGTNPTYSSTGGSGFIFGIEPAQYVGTRFRIGLRMEAAMYGSTSAGTTSTSNDKNLGPMGSLSLTGQYFFTDEKARPFVGAGVGYFVGQGNFGFFPRAGFQVGDLDFIFEYNVIPACLSDFSAASQTFTSTGAYYFGVRLSYFFRWTIYRQVWE